MQKDRHEGLDMFPSTDNPEHWPLNTPDQWPKRPSDYKEIMEEYVSHMLALGNVLMQGMALGLRLSPEFFQPFMDKSFWIMRAIHYPIRSLQTSRHSPPTDTPNSNSNSNSSPNPTPILHPRHSKEESDSEYPWGIGCGEHRDYGCLTMICHDELYGSECLQVKNCQNEWITIDGNNIEPGKDSIVINIGDMLHYWSNGFYQSTPHRVLNPKPKESSIQDPLYRQTGRVSVPFFYEPNWDCVVEPIDFNPATSEKISAYTLKHLPWEEADQTLLKPKATPSSSFSSSSPTLLQTQQIENLHTNNRDDSGKIGVANLPFLFNGPVKYGDHLKSKLLNNFAQQDPN